MPWCATCGDSPFSLNRAGICLRCTHGTAQKSPTPYKRPRAGQARIPAIYRQPVLQAHQRQLALWRALVGHAASSHQLAKTHGHREATVREDLTILAEYGLVVRERGTKQWFCLVRPPAPLEHDTAPSAEHAEGSTRKDIPDDNAF